MEKTWAKWSEGDSLSKGMYRMDPHLVWGPRKATRGDGCQCALFIGDTVTSTEACDSIAYVRKPELHHTATPKAQTLYTSKVCAYTESADPEAFKWGGKRRLEMLSFLFWRFIRGINFCTYRRAQCLLCGRWPGNTETAVNIEEGTSPWKASRWTGTLHSLPPRIIAVPGQWGNVTLPRAAKGYYWI